MPVRVLFDDGNWPSTLQSVLPSRGINYTLEWKKNEVIIHYEHDGRDDLIPSSYPDPYDEGDEMDGASA